jgi:hypothetical protein
LRRGAFEEEGGGGRVKEGMKVGVAEGVEVVEEGVVKGEGWGWMESRRSEGEKTAEKVENSGESGKQRRKWTAADLDHGCLGSTDADHQPTSRGEG